VKVDDLTEQQLDQWLLACVADPSIVTPAESGYNLDGTHRLTLARALMLAILDERAP
jgi:hypothetical protein